MQKLFVTIPAKNLHVPSQDSNKIEAWDFHERGNITLLLEANTIFYVKYNSRNKLWPLPGCKS
eukprot:snap_masked-scaffold_15-processed-gene-4.43-mRNA-1 protein AED:1.00 eAED:1.00 QI:0/-1/0/0/-1/1/1/0/62